MDFLQIPNRGSLTENVIFHFQPKSKYHINDKRRTDGDKRSVNKKQSNVRRSHFKHSAKPRADSEGTLLKKTFNSLNRIHGLLMIILFPMAQFKHFFCEQYSFFS
jgi:hypothetical protein